MSSDRTGHRLAAMITMIIPGLMLTLFSESTASDPGAHPGGLRIIGIVALVMGVSIFFFPNKGDFGRFLRGFDRLVDAEPCPKCGRENAPQATFCSGCGCRLVAP